MRRDSETAVLRGDNAPQYRAQQAMQLQSKLWHADPNFAPAYEELKRFGDGAEFADCPQLSELMTDPGRARSMIDHLISSFAKSMRAEPLGLVPFRHQVTDAGATLVLANCGQAQLLLVSRDPQTLHPNTVGFSDVERYDLVVAGSSKAFLVDFPEQGGAPNRTDIKWIPGSHIAFSGPERSLIVTEIFDPLVVLRLVRHKPDAAPTTQHSLETGEMLGRAAGSIFDSRNYLAVSLLGAMERADAAPVLADLVEQGSADVRWHALRHCLALDTEQGFLALDALASKPQDPLHGNATALREQLLAAHPQLNALCHKEAA